MSRYAFNKIIYLITALLCLPIISVRSQEHSTLHKLLNDYTVDKKAEIGVAVVIDGKDTITLNNNVSYPMMSVYKLHQAVAVADKLSSKNISLETLLYVSNDELKKDTYSPLRDKYPEGNRYFSVKELLRYTLLLSDNNACDILFDRIISVQQTDSFLRSSGIGDCYIKATESEMHDNNLLCYENSSSPLAATELLELLLNGKLLKGEYNQFIISTLLECKTGQNRLPAFVHDNDVRIGHKTGTGGINDNNEIIAVNDIGFVLLPDGRRYTIAVFVKDSKETMAESEKIISDISKMVYSHVTK